MQQTLLTAEDSKRVADALITKIEEADFSVAEGVRSAIRSLVMPEVSPSDWFPSLVDKYLDDIVGGVIRAAHEYERPRKKRAGAGERL